MRRLVPMFLVALLAVAGCGRQNGADDTKTLSAFAPAAGDADTAQQPSGLDDAEAAQSYASPVGVKLTTKAPSPDAARASVSAATEESNISPGAPSDEEVAAELKQMEAVQKKISSQRHGITLNADGTATPAPGVPAVVQRVIAGANAIAKFPYVYGGGHGSFVDTAYDCSGSLSYALAAGGLLTSTKTSGELANMGEKGPGKWITIYANAGHTFMYVDGLRYDTSGRGGPLGTRWSKAPRSLAGFEVRHPAGL